MQPFTHSKQYIAEKDWDTHPDDVYLDFMMHCLRMIQDGSLCSRYASSSSTVRGKNKVANQTK